MRLFDFVLASAFIVVGIFACATHTFDGPSEPSLAGDASADDGGGFGVTAAGPTQATPTGTGAGGVGAGDAESAGLPEAQATIDAPAGLPVSSVPDDACVAPLSGGALVIDELMIESVAGSGDTGEWLEVKSTRSCATNLRGLHGSCAHGSKVSFFDVTADMWLPPGGTFVIADSGDPAVDHDLPGTLLVWHKQPSDVLRNKGATVTLSLDDVMIDALTYPSMPLTVGVSLAFPADCDPSLRSDFKQWQPSQSSWFPAFYGTPNAPNTDVACLPPTPAPTSASASP